MTGHEIPRPRFRIGDRVWSLHTYRERLERDCAVCEGTGEIGVVGHPDLHPTCPAEGCRYGKVRSESPTLLASIRPGTVGKVSASVMVEDPDDLDNVESEVRVMLYETGVGSGTVWHEHDLYATRGHAAQAAAEVGAVDDRGRYAREETRARRY